MKYLSLKNEVFVKKFTVITREFVYKIIDIYVMLYILLYCYH